MSNTKTIVAEVNAENAAVRQKMDSLHLALAAAVDREMAKERRIEQLEVGLRKIRECGLLECRECKRTVDALLAEQQPEE